MSVRHHPADHWIFALAAGSLDEAQAIVVATHVNMCGRCRALLDRAEAVGGALLNELEPAPLSDGAFDRLMARIDAETADPIVLPTRPGVPAPLAPFVPGGFDALPWRNLGPGVKGVRLDVGRGREDSRLWLLRARPGAVLPRHGHNGAELTLVLKGAFTDEAGRFAAGDLEEADGDVRHQPRIEMDGECICLAATQGMLRLDGLFARLAQPFIGL